MTGAPLYHVVTNAPRWCATDAFCPPHKYTHTWAPVPLDEAKASCEWCELNAPSGAPWQVVAAA